MGMLTLEQMLLFIGIPLVVLFICALFAILKSSDNEYEEDFQDYIESVQEKTKAFRRGDFAAFQAVMRRRMPTLKSKSLYEDPKTKVKKFFFRGESIKEDTEVSVHLVKFEGVGFLFSSLEDYTQFREWFKEENIRQTQLSKSQDLGAWK